MGLVPRRAVETRRVARRPGLIGSVDEFVGHIHTCGERWGITYFVVRALDDFAPVLDAFA